MVAILGLSATLSRGAWREDPVSAATTVKSAPDAFTGAPTVPRFTAAVDSATSAPGRSFGCLKQRPSATDAGQTLLKKLTSGGIEREYRLHLSARPAADAPQPLVLAFHGRGGRGAIVEAASGLLPLSDSEGFFLVSPEGTGSPRGWSAGASMPTWPTDDVAFVSDLLDRIEADHCVDTTRIYAVGHSNGGFLVSRLGCALGQRFAAIVTVAGLSTPKEPCRGAVAVLAFHGTADDVVPFNGGPVRLVYRYGGVRAALTAWSKLNGCSGGPAVKPLSKRTLFEDQQGCRRPVSLILTNGGGHDWPAAADVKAGEAIWAFLKQQRLS